MVAFLFFATVNSEENAISSNKQHEFNFYSGIFDFNDDGKRSAIFGIQHQNETLVEG